ncbi:MAG: hypothetical protein H6Q65_1881 [Firmicutes bacterium]|nr:hypothetical protein [Bacillota bacterium]
MTEIKRHTSKHLKAARQWLLQAEDSFGQDRDVRGELDLLLAQAELRHAQETNRSRQWRYRYPLLKQGLAFCLAFAVTAVGIGGAYWSLHRQPPVVVQKPVESQITKSLPSSQRVETIVSAHAQTHDSTLTRQQPVQATVQSSAKEEPFVSVAERKSDKDVVLTPDQMQDLVRTAGKSLRGQ